MTTTRQSIRDQRVDELLAVSGTSRALRAADLEKVVPDAVGEKLSHRLLLPGDVIFRLGTQRPAGAILANGAAVSRSKYQALFNAIGVTAGAGDGSTTFNLPNIPSYSGMSAFIVT